MVINRKHDGTPRRPVDLSPLNKFCKRETFASETPFHLARRIPGRPSDGYNRRFNAILAEFERKERCVDDTIFYDTEVENHWRHTIEFFTQVGRAGIVLKPDKFQIAELTVDFAGFRISESTAEPLPKYINAIINFPKPQSITDIRSWFGLVNQVANCAQLRDLLQHSNCFSVLNGILSDRTR